MNYMCAYHWGREDSVGALVLKQLVFRREGIPVVFGCLAQNGSDFIEIITEWFCERGVFFCDRGESGMKALVDCFAEEMSDISDKTEAATVLLCIGSQFVLWGKGNKCNGIKVWLLNSRFGRPHFRCILAGEVNYGEIISGRLEQGVGILAATEDFLDCFSEEEILKCLEVKGLDSERRVQKRLSELGQEAERKGDGHPMAMLIVTCQ